MAAVMGRPQIAVDLRSLEDLIADKSNTMGDVADLLGVDRNTIYARKDSDAGFNRAYLRGMVRREAACIDSNGSKPDDLIMRAVGLGFGTRRELREALEFDYAVIEKCIECNWAELDMQMAGQIERFKLRTPLTGDGEIVATPPTNQLVCPKCGGPKTERSEQCMKCYKPELPANVRSLLESKELCGCGRASNHGGRCSYRRQTSPSLHDELQQQKRSNGDGVAVAADTVSPRVEIDAVKAGELRAQGLTHEKIAKEPGVNFWTYNDRRYSDKELKAALDEGHRRYKESKGKSLTALERVSARAPVAPKKTNVNERLEKLIVKDEPRSAFCLKNCFPDDERIGHHINCEYWTDEERETIRREQELEAKVPTAIKRAWSKDFENDNTEDGVAGLTMLYLVSLLHDGMEQVEKDAVWTLIQYLKRMQAAIEAAK